MWSQACNSNFISLKPFRVSSFLNKSINFLNTLLLGRCVLDQVFHVPAFENQVFIFFNSDTLIFCTLFEYLWWIFSFHKFNIAYELCDGNYFLWFCLHPFFLCSMLIGWAFWLHGNIHVDARVLKFSSTGSAKDLSYN